MSAFETASMNRKGNESLSDFIRHLTIAVSNATFYSPEHNQVSRLILLAFNALTEFLRKKSELTIMFVDDQVIAENTPMPNNLYMNKFYQIFTAAGIGHLRIRRSIAHKELSELILALSKPYGVQKELRSMSSIHLGRLSAGEEGSIDHLFLDRRGKNVPTLSELPKEDIEKLRDIYDSVKQNRKINVTGVYEIVLGIIDALIGEADALLALSPLRIADEYTFTHATNTCILNLAQAMALKIEGPLLRDIGVAAMLHDIGKLFIPDDLLKKTGELTEKEWELMRQHPVRGALYLLDTPGVPRLAAIVAYEHHMKYKFTGYPKVSPDWIQNICSHMTTISDYFDALRTNRVYRSSIGKDMIYDMMRGLAGKELHPELTKNFINAIEKSRDSRNGNEKNRLIPASIN